MSGATKNATNSAASGSRRGVGEDVIAARRATMRGTRVHPACAVGELRAGATSSPPPLAGEGQGGGHGSRQSVSPRPLPNPPPLAREGADRTCRSQGFHFAGTALIPLRDYSLISRLKRSISAPRCGLSLSQAMVRILARSSRVLASATEIAPSNFTLAAVGAPS